MFLLPALVRLIWRCVCLECEGEQFVILRDKKLSKDVLQSILSNVTVPESAVNIGSTQ